MMPSSVVLLGIVLTVLAPTSTGCPFSMHSGDVTSHTAYIQASFSHPLCRSRDHALLHDVAHVSVSRFRNFASPVVSHNVTVTSYHGLDPRQFPGGFAAKVSLSALNAHTRYYYRFTSPSGVVSPLGMLRTLPTKKAPLHFVVMSAANQAPFPVATALYDFTVRKDAHFGLFLGDSVLSVQPWEGGAAPCPPTEECYRDLYAQQRDSNYTGRGFPAVFRRLPVFVVWDDNEVYSDYVGQNGDAPRVFQDDGTDQRGINLIDPHLAEAYYEIGTRTFLEMNAITPGAQLQVHDPAPGVARPERRLFRRFSPSPEVDVFVLDVRQYRDPAESTSVTIPVLPHGVGPNFTCEGAYSNPFLCAVLPGPHGTDRASFRPGKGRSLLGSVQKRWLKRGLKSSSAKFKVIASSATMLHAFISPRERWEGYWDERRDLISFIESNSISGVVFAGSGINSAMLARLNPGTEPAIHEVVTGPAGGFTASSLLGPAIEAITDLIYRFGSNSHLRAEEDRAIKFLRMDASAFLSVRVNAGVMTVRCIGADGKVMTDMFGNTGIMSIS